MPCSVLWTSQSPPKRRRFFSSASGKWFFVDPVTHCSPSSIRLWSDRARKWYPWSLYHAAMDSGKSS
ncbi:MAG: hypothetical protein ACKPGK_12835, partial [Verrucomicrobiota bacterium]